MKKEYNKNVKKLIYKVNIYYRLKKNSVYNLYSICINNYSFEKIDNLIDNYVAKQKILAIQITYWYNKLTQREKNYLKAYTKFVNGQWSKNKAMLYLGVNTRNFFRIISKINEKLKGI